MFNERRLFYNHLFTFPRTFLLFKWNSIELQWVQSMLVSSANKTGNAFLFKTAGRSLMYKRNSVGPNMEPCGTPCLITAQFEIVVFWFSLSSIWTRWYLPLIYDWISSLPLPIIPYFSVFYINMSWSTQSNAFVRSQKIPPTICLLFKAFNTSFISLKTAFSVENPFWNRYCS
jgi:hypothetical protein